MKAKQEILARLRNALDDQPEAPTIPRAYRRSTDADPAAVRAKLIGRLEDYRASVYEAKWGELREVLAGLIDGKAVVPDGIERSWLPAIEEVEDPLEAACVVTSSTVSCAETGTIILTAQPAEGRRALSLIPDHHICLVPADTIVDIFPEAWQRVAAAGSAGPITMISGPSATSDIELERVEGVHGPRVLDVVIVD